MCGICGQYNFGSQAPVQRRDIEAMAKSIDHRGPDDDGYYISGPLGFGFRRLSIIDLSGGHQPMFDHEESVWVIFNGEIYNFIEIKGELQALGHIFFELDRIQRSSSTATSSGATTYSIILTACLALQSGT